MKSARLLILLLVLPLTAVPSSFAWGAKGHKIINHLAAQSLPDSLPAFLRSPAALDEITYLGPEPDRWRSPAEPELVAAQAPDHFIDLEWADRLGTLPRKRYDYIAACYAYIAAHPAEAAEMRPEHIGFQPYITEEVWERLKSAMRDYRQLSAAHQDTAPVEAAIVFYAGWLGHYVADGSQPLHTTIQYNGWTGPNPNGYTTDHQIHWQFESQFVDAAINESDVQALMMPPQAIGDEWTDYLAYLRHTNSLVERVYQFDKEHGFDGTGTPDSRHFTAERLAAGASMLRDLIVAAWVKSAEPVPEWHHEAPKAASSTPPVANGTGGGPAGAKDATPPQQATPMTAESVNGPAPTYIVAPQYTKEARKAKLQGICVVGVTVGTDGKPENIHVVRSLGMGLDEKAIEAVKQYRFKPAMYKGKPVPVAVDVEVNFRLNNW